MKRNVACILLLLVVVAALVSDAKGEACCSKYTFRSCTPTTRSCILCGMTCMR
jgi:hypothetical protein